MSELAEGETKRNSTPLEGLSRYGGALRKAWPGYVPAAAMSVIIITTFAALFAGVVSPHDPIKQSLIDSRLGPAWVDGGSTEFLLGTDFFGRDILTRLIYGARISLSIGGLVILVGATVGTIVGISAGFFGGVVDSILMRIVDIVLSLPLILVAIVLVVVLGASTSNVILVVTLLRQELVSCGILIGSTFNVSVSHCSDVILNDTALAFDTALTALSSYLSSPDPSRYLKGDLIRPVFQVSN